MSKDGVFVMGIGSSDRNISFKDTCTVFKNLEDLPSSVGLDAASWETLFNWKEAIKETISYYAREDGWAFLSQVAQIVGISHPDFDPRHYCYGDLSSIVRSCPEFEMHDSGRVRLRSA